MIFVYWGVMLLGQSLAKGGYAGPWLATWLPNLLLGAAGLVALYRQAGPVRRRRTLAPPALPGLARRVRRVAGASVVSRVPDSTWLRPTLLDLYVGLLYLRVLALGLVGMAGLFYAPTFIDLSDHLFKGTATTGMLLADFWWATPQFVYYIIAIAVLLAAVVTIGALTKSSELIVMRACGISLYLTAVPLLIVSTGASLVLFALEEQDPRAGQPAGQRAELPDSRPESSHFRHLEPQVAHRRRRRALPLPGLQPWGAGAEPTGSPCCVSIRRTPTG